MAARRPVHARSVPARYRVHASFFVASTAFTAIFVAVVLSAFHAPAPHNVPVGIVGPATVTGKIEDAVGSAVHGGFRLREYRSEASARTGIAQRQVDGALIVSGGQLRLLVAQAGGTGPAQALIRIFGAVAARSGHQLTVTDVAPPLAGDTEGLSPFFVVLGVLFPSLAAGSASALGFRRARAAWSVGAPVAVAIIFGAVAAAIADGIAGLGDYAAIGGIVALFSLAVAAPTAALARIRPPLVSVAVLAFVVAGIPVSGGPGNLASFGPDFLRVLDPALPLGAAASAVRNVVYFGGHSTAGHVWVLAAWALAGVAVLVLVAAFRRPAPARAAALGAGLSAPGLPAGAYPDLQPGVHRPGPGRSLVPAAQKALTPSPLPPDPGPPLPGSARLPGTPGPGAALPITLVVGFDNSEPARRALSWAARLLTVRPGALHVIYADNVLVESDLSGFGQAAMEQARDQKAAGVAAAAAEIAAGAGVQYTFERRLGSPADAILSAASVQAATAPATLPVLVTGRPGHAAHHVIGSVPVRLLHHSLYPVLTIP